MGVMEGKSMEQLVERENKVEESQTNGEESEYFNTKEGNRKLSKTELIKQLLITIDVQSPSDTMPTKARDGDYLAAREDGDYPAAREDGDYPAAREDGDYPAASPSTNSSPSTRHSSPY